MKSNRISGDIILASASPRRSELMSLAGIPCTVAPADICEDPLPGESAAEHVERLAEAKARAVPRKIKGRYVIGADTVVVLGGQIMGKPVDEADAFRMLSALSGTTHEVITGFTVLDRQTGVCISRAVTTDVTFRHLDDAEISDYIASGCPMDKAGSYAIQGGAIHIVRSIHGSYSNVVGLPMAELFETLRSVDAIATMRHPKGRTS